MDEESKAKGILYMAKVTQLWTGWNQSSKERNLLQRSGLWAIFKPTLQKWKTNWELRPTNLPDVSSGTVKTMLESLHTEYENASLVFHVLHVAYTYLPVKFASTSKDEQKQEGEFKCSMYRNTFQLCNSWRLVLGLGNYS